MHTNNKLCVYTGFASCLYKSRQSTIAVDLFDSQCLVIVLVSKVDLQPLCLLTGLLVKTNKAINCYCCMFDIWLLIALASNDDEPHSSDEDMYLRYDRPARYLKGVL